MRISSIRTQLFHVVLVGLLGACGTGASGSGRGPRQDGGTVPPGSGIEDAGPPDAGAPDAGSRDGGAPASGDGGSPADGGSTGSDAGTGGRQILVPPEGRVYHGVFPAGRTEPDADISLAEADAYAAAVGRPLAWIYFSNEWSRGTDFPMHTAEGVRARGAVPFIRLHIRSTTQQLVVDPVYTLERIAAGEFDGQLRHWADGAIAFGTPLIVQYGTEINGDWNEWSAPYNGGWVLGPDRFKAAYRHIVEVMRARGANNISWGLHYNGENWPADNPLNVPASYYPGDDVVDWIGFSIYGSYGASDRKCRDFFQELEFVMAGADKATTTKPLFVFELGTSVNGQNCPATPWVQGALEALLSDRYPRVRGFSWWDDATSNGEIRMRPSLEPELRDAFRSAFQGPHGGALLDRPLLP